MLALVLSLTLAVSAAAEPDVTYADVKAALAATYSFALGEQRLRSAMRTGFDIGTGCESGASFVIPLRSRSAPVWTLDPLLVERSMLAFDVLTLQARLPQLGYPPQLWAEPLERFEAAEAARAPSDGIAGYAKRFDAFRQSLITTLDAYRRAHPSAAALHVDDIRCGPPVTRFVNLETQPAGGSIFVIPTFFYELCRARKIDPNDVTPCDRWREAVSGVVTYVAGDYYYQAHWSDGSRRTGRLNFDAAENAQRIELRKP